jgi:hypothetical protein
MLATRLPIKCTDGAAQSVHSHTTINDTARPVALANELTELVCIRRSGTRGVADVRMSARKRGPTAVDGRSTTITSDRVPPGRFSFVLFCTARLHKKGLAQAVGTGALHVVELGH